MVCSVIEGTAVFADDSSLVIVRDWSFCRFESRSICESASDLWPGSSFGGTLNTSPFRTRPRPTKRVINPGETKGQKSGSASAITTVTIVSAKPTVAVITPARIRRNLRSSGDSKNFCSGGRRWCATCSRSLLDSTSRIFSANALLICSRAETADAVIASGRSRVVRTSRRSVPHARQY